MFDQATFDSMIRYGDTFSKKLAELWRVANARQSEILIRSFPGDFGAAKTLAESYRAMRMLEKPNDLVAKKD